MHPQFPHSLSPPPCAPCALGAACGSRTGDRNRDRGRSRGRAGRAAGGGLKTLISAAAPDSQGPGGHEASLWLRSALLCLFCLGRGAKVAQGYEAAQGSLHCPLGFGRPTPASPRSSFDSRAGGAGLPFCPHFGLEALAVPESLHLDARGTASTPALLVGGVCWGGVGAVGAWESRVGPPPRDPPHTPPPAISAGGLKP